MTRSILTWCTWNMRTYFSRLVVTRLALSRSILFLETSRSYKTVTLNCQLTFNTFYPIFCHFQPTSFKSEKGGFIVSFLAISNHTIIEAEQEIFPLTSLVMEKKYFYNCAYFMIWCSGDWKLHPSWESSKMFWTDEAIIQFNIG